ncbi:hypothetical protein Gasu2_65670 [Galdieria sulphuraria]|nr:hypothetical protein Gasu2_65670 [Galdieria sulphuraria]
MRITSSNEFTTSTLEIALEKVWTLVYAINSEYQTNLRLLLFYTTIVKASAYKVRFGTVPSSSRSNGSR